MEVLTIFPSEFFFDEASLLEIEQIDGLTLGHNVIQRVQAFVTVLRNDCHLALLIYRKV